MSRPAPLEIAANSLASAQAAQAGGADRVELCGSLGEGGITPSHGVIAIVRERLRIPVYVLIRPRAGDFLYDEAEQEIMRRDIEACVRIGCDGVVIGALNADGAIHTETCRGLIAAAGVLGVTFHRAFDAARDQASALEDIIALGCERLLTSGASATAFDGAKVIASMVRQAAGRIRIMAGAGIHPDNVVELAVRSGADEFHASASRPRGSAMRWRHSALKGLDADYTQSDPAVVAALVSRLRGLAVM